MLIRISSGRPIYQQIYESLRQQILEQTLCAGSKLPSSRELASELSVSRNAVIQAYEQLLAEGYAHSRSGAGTFVSKSMPGDPADHTACEAEPATRDHRAALSKVAQHLSRFCPPEIIAMQQQRPHCRYNFRPGTVSLDQQSSKIWQRLVRQSASMQSGNYDHPQGLLELRQVLAQHLRRYRHCRCNENTLMIVNGSQNALDLIGRLLLNPGDYVAMENPGYPQARMSFQLHQANIHSVEVDDEGINVDALEQLQPTPKLVFVTPSHQFPSGACLSFARRLQLLEWAEKNNAFVIEDDYDSEYRHTGRPLESLQGLDRHDRVFYTGTFSKLLYPGIRLAYLILPEKLIATANALRWLSDWHSSTLSQQALYRWMKEGYHEQHLRRMRTRYRRRRDTLMTSLQNHFEPQTTSLSGSEAGLHLVMYMNTEAAIDDFALIGALEQQDVSAYPLSFFYASSPPRSGLILGYSAIAEDDIERGVQHLKVGLEQMPTR